MTWELNKKEYFKRYYEKNKGRINKKRRKWYLGNDSFKKYRVKYMRKWSKEYSSSIKKAHQILHIAIVKGKIKIGRCEVCGVKKVHGHHVDYSKPLKVMWLCPVHHKLEHKLNGHKIKNK